MRGVESEDETMKKLEELFKNHVSHKPEVLKEESLREKIEKQETLIEMNQFCMDLRMMG